MITIAELKAIFLFIAITFSNPFIPDFGTQLIVAIFIGMILPSKVVKPLHELIHRIPQVKKFEKKIEKHKHVRKLIKSKNERIRTIVSRVLAGYIITYLIALLAGLAYAYLEFFY